MTHACCLTIWKIVFACLVTHRTTKVNLLLKKQLNSIFDFPCYHKMKQNGYVVQLKRRVFAKQKCTQIVSNGTKDTYQFSGKRKCAERDVKRIIQLD